jgi:Ca2+-binding RTX toxin-like protein
MLFPHLHQLKQEIHMKVIILLVLLTMCSTVQAAVFNIAPGDENGLINAIHQSNANGETNVINLSPGVYEFTSASDSDSDWGKSGLPAVKQGTKLTINGPSLQALGDPAVLIKRGSGAEKFRLLLNKGNLTLNRILLRDGDSSKDGAGIANTESGKLKLSYCQVSWNKATDGAIGGGIHNKGRLFISKSTINNNKADYGAGIYSAGDLKLNSTTVNENVATWNGGGIYSAISGTRQTFEATNSTFADNDAGYRGAGLLVHFGAAQLNHTTIAYNEVTGGDGDGGGIYNFNASLKIMNTIVANNYRNSEINDCGGTLTSQGYNLISANTCGFNSTNGDIVGTVSNPIDPRLGEANENDEGNGAPDTIALFAGSPAIDAIPTSACASLDQRSFARPTVVESNRTPCDIGAHEQNAKPTCLGVLTAFVATKVGTSADETLVGTAGIDVIHGLGGNDTIQGLESGDFICGGTGDDTLNGDEGSDVLFGQEGDDVINAGPGSDVIWGGTYETGTNELNGQSGNDTIVGGIGDDKMNGGDGRKDSCNGASEINADTQTNCEIVKNIP